MYMKKLTRVLEFFLTILIEVWNYFVTELRLPLSSIDISELYNTKDASTNYDCSDFLMRDLIDLSNDETRIEFTYSSLQATTTETKDPFDIVTEPIPTPSFVFDLIDFHTDGNYGQNGSVVSGSKSFKNDIFDSVDEHIFSSAICKPHDDANQNYEGFETDEIRSPLYSNVCSKEMFEVAADYEIQSIGKTGGDPKIEEYQRQGTAEGNKCFGEVAETVDSEMEKIVLSNELKCTVNSDENEFPPVCTENHPQTYKIIERNYVFKKSNYSGDIADTLTPSFDNDIEVCGSEFKELGKIGSELFTKCSSEILNEGKVKGENLIENSYMNDDFHSESSNILESKASELDGEKYENTLENSEIQEREYQSSEVRYDDQDAECTLRCPNSNCTEAMNDSKITVENFDLIVNSPEDSTDSVEQECVGLGKTESELPSKHPSEIINEVKVEDGNLIKNRCMNDDLNNESSIILEINAPDSAYEKYENTLENAEIREKGEYQSLLSDMSHDDQKAKCPLRCSDSYCFKAMDNSKVTDGNPDLVTSSEDSSESDQQKYVQDYTLLEFSLLVESDYNSSGGKSFFDGLQLNEIKCDEELKTEKESSSDCFDAQTDTLLPCMNLTDIQSESYGESLDNTEDENTDSERQNFGYKKHTGVSSKDAFDEDTDKNVNHFKYNLLSSDLQIGEGENVTQQGGSVRNEDVSNDLKYIKSILKTEPSSETKTVHFNPEIDTFLFEPSAIHEDIRLEDRGEQLLSNSSESSSEEFYSELKSTSKTEPSNENKIVSFNSEREAFVREGIHMKCGGKQLPSNSSESLLSKEFHSNRKVVKSTLKVASNETKTAHFNSETDLGPEICDDMPVEGWREQLPSTSSDSSSATQPDRTTPIGGCDTKNTKSIMELEKHVAEMHSEINEEIETRKSSILQHLKKMDPRSIFSKIKKKGRGKK